MVGHLGSGEILTADLRGVFLGCLLTVSSEKVWGRFKYCLLVLFASTGVVVVGVFVLIALGGVVAVWVRRNAKRG